ncbi:MAG: O-antigen ligase family protein [Halomonas sp.]|nr:O-antigen ligase family protein [Halomonas sp.]MCC5881599.1 O-antigen ligase family protein [Halomonas sp.]
MHAMMLAAPPLLMPFGYWLALVAVLMWTTMTGWRRVPGVLTLTWQRNGWLLAVLLGFGVVELLMGVWHQELGRALPMAAAAWGAALLLLTLGRRPPVLAAWWAGLAVAGLGAGGWALYQRVFEAAARASGHAPLHAILFGNLSLLAGLLCLAGIGWAWGRPHRGTWVTLLVAGAVGGVLSSVLSGTRGGWLALPLALVLFYRGYLYRWQPIWRVGILAGVLAAMVAAYAVPQSGVQPRVDAAVSEGQDFLSGEVRGSVGLRLEMMRGAGLLILERPWLGHGHEGYRPGMQRLVEEGRLAAGVEHFWHAHNELLDAWVRRGLPGLAMVLALYLMPLWLFAGRLRASDPVHRSLAVAGMLLPVTFMDFGLSYPFFAYPVGMLVYGSWLTAIWLLIPVAQPHRIERKSNVNRSMGPAGRPDCLGC